ncbi:MAG TPA: HEAT repeat domain-containing protein [Candidatus Sulfotelmatobacter sp.]|nr:HEAT repeat domain-containing protein [Candidatus Sulfotelmatobacter sp.]
MSIALIEESAKEVRRLAIAGSPLAVGDFRLKKLIPPLEQAGAKVPVFAQVAKAINDVVNATEAESAARLLNLSTLLNAILYTQGQTSTTGDFQKLEIFPSKCSTTRTTARVLKPLIEALSSSGGGRLEIIKSAVERGAFNDLRLIDPAIRALGDNYPEIADLVAEKILPAYGPGIIPRLKTGLDLKGKKHDARKLEVMHRLDPVGTLDLCKNALEDGSPEVKIAAIACLGQHEDCLPLVLEQASAKNKQVRAAALEALAEHDRPEITKIFSELIGGKAFDILVRPFRRLRNRQVLNSLLDEGRTKFDLILKGDSQQILLFHEILNCLASRRDSEVEKFFLEIFAKSVALTKLALHNLSVKVNAVQNAPIQGADLMERLVERVYGIGSRAALEAILERREDLPTSVFPYVLRSAVRTWPPDKVYSEFSPLLEGKTGAGKEKREMLEGFINTSHARLEQPPDAGEDADRQSMPESLTWDPCWLDAAIKADSRVIVCWLARPNHIGSLNYLWKLGTPKSANHTALTVRALARCQHPNVTDFFIGQVARKSKGANYLDYELQTLLESAKHLPASDLPKLDAFATKLDEKFADAYLVAIEPLRRPNQPD